MKVDGKEVVQLYVKNLKDVRGTPHHSLRKIKKIHLKPEERKRVCFTVNAEDFALFDEEGRCRLEPGKFQIFVGGNQPDRRSRELTGQDITHCVIELHREVME